MATRTKKKIQKTKSVKKPAKRPAARPKVKEARERTSRRGGGVKAKGEVLENRRTLMLSDLEQPVFDLIKKHYQDAGLFGEGKYVSDSDVLRSWCLPFLTVCGEHFGVDMPASLTTQPFDRVEAARLSVFGKAVTSSDVILESDVKAVVVDTVSTGDGGVEAAPVSLPPPLPPIDEVPPSFTPVEDIDL